MRTATFLQITPPYILGLIIFILIILFYVAGHRLSVKHTRNNVPDKLNDPGVTVGILLGLLTLLLAFTFGMANSRFDNRRELTIEEANDIGTAILRTEVYPDSVKQLLRAGLKEYVEERINYYQSDFNIAKIRSHFLKADSIGKGVWSIAANYASKNPSLTIASQMLPALNAMIDVTTTRRSAGESTIPDSIMYFLFALCFCSAFLLGYQNKTKIDWTILLGFAIMLSVTVFTIIDLDRPRAGLIIMDNANQKIIELREMFK